jgi:hypothetical protein
MRTGGDDCPTGRGERPVSDQTDVGEVISLSGAFRRALESEQLATVPDDEINFPFQTSLLAGFVCRVFEKSAE